MLLMSKPQSKGVPMNKTVKKLLEEPPGVKPQSDDAHRRGFEEFCGIWSKADADEFQKQTADFAKVDPGGWQ